METRDWRTALDLELENSSLLSKLSVLLGDDLSPNSLIYFLYLKSLVEVHQANISLVASSYIGPSGAVQTVSDSHRPLFWSERRCADGV